MRKFLILLVFWGMVCGCKTLDRQMKLKSDLGIRSDVFHVSFLKLNYQAKTVIK